MPLFIVFALYGYDTGFPFSDDVYILKMNLEAGIAFVREIHHEVMTSTHTETSLTTSEVAGAERKDKLECFGLQKVTLYVVMDSGFMVARAKVAELILPLVG